MATRVAVVTATTGATNYYDTYLEARTAAIAGDKIQIWGDLNEQIVLKHLVDITIVPGIVLDMTSALPTITDNGSAVTCNVFGNGIIKNNNNSGNCIKISNGSSNVSIQCDVIDGLGGFGTTGDPYNGASVLIKNITDAQKFSLICNKVNNQYNAAIAFDNVSGGTNKNTISIKAKRVDTGVVDDDNSTPALVLKGTGFVDIQEINSLNSGSCLLVQAGTITANILKMTTKNVNHFSAPYFPAVEVSGGDGTQKLYLYFDEIQNLLGGDAVKVSKGTASLIGRRIYSESGLSMDLTDDIVSALVQCDEIISGTKGIRVKNNNQQIVIDANYIEGKSPNNTSGVVTCVTNSKLMLRNAKIKNVGSANNSTGIYIDSGFNHFIELENIIVVTFDPNQTNNRTIYRDGSNLDVKNLLVFLNKSATNITFKIGTDLNKKVIVDALIT